MIYACVPVDRSRLPQGPDLDSIKVTDLYTLKNCESGRCGQAIWVGPRQMEAITNDPTSMVLCYECTFELSRGGMPIFSLGGGAGVEGTVRVTT